MPAKEDFNFSGPSGSNSYLLSKPQGGLQHANGKNGAARQGGKEVGNVSGDSFLSEEDDDVDAADDDLSGSIDHDSKPAPQAAPRQSVPQVSMASGSAAASMRPSDQTKPIAVRSAQQHNLSASGETADLLLSRENSHHAASPRNGPSQAALGSATPSKRISSPTSSPGNPAQAAVNNPISGSNRPSSTSLPMQPQFNASAGATHSAQQQQASNASTVFGSAAAQQAALSRPNSSTSTPRMSGPGPLPYTAAAGSPADTSRQHPVTPSQLQNAADRAAASRRASGNSQIGSPGLGYDPLGSLPVPQLHDGGRSPMASYGGDMSDGLLRMGHSPLGQSARQSHAGSTVSTTRRNRLAESEFNIPLPLELFCMYDQDGSGGVGKKEFVHLVRDVDGHPVHYAEDDDPEYKRDEAKAALAVLEAKLEKCKKKLEVLDGPAEDAPTTPAPEAAGAEPATSQNAGAAGAAAADECAAGKSPQGKLQRDTAPKRAQGEQLDKKKEQYEQLIKKVKVKLEKYAKEAADLVASGKVDASVREHRKRWREAVEKEFRRVDTSCDDMLSMDEFHVYYYSKLCFKFPVLRTGSNPGAALFNIFVKYCGYGRNQRSEEMLLSQFSKLCRDAGLLNHRKNGVTQAAVDIIYYRARAADEQLETFVAKAGVAATARMYYPQFTYALGKIAEKRKSGFQEVVAKILTAVSAVPAASAADFLVLSGMDCVSRSATPGHHTMQHPKEMLLRHPLLPKRDEPMLDADIVNKMKAEAAMALRMSGVPHDKLPKGLRVAHEKLGAFGSAPTNPDALYCPTTPARPARSNTVAGATSPLGTTGTGPAGAGAAGAGDSMEYSADGDHTLAAGVSAAASPGDVAGVAGASGPEAMNGQGGECAASEAATDPMELYKSMNLEQSTLKKFSWETKDPVPLEVWQRGTKALSNPGVMATIRDLQPDVLMGGLKKTFEAFNAWNGGINRSSMNKVQWGKALRDAQLIRETGGMPLRKASTIYDKVLPASSKALNFPQFLEALRHVAVTLRVSLNEVMEALVAVGRPEGP